MKVHLRSALGMLGAGLLLVALGCESPPARVYRGARHYAAGTDALALGENARAVTELEQAAALVPVASEIQNHLGLAYWAQGRVGEARSAFETALDLDCDNEAARQNLESLSSLGVETETSVPQAGKRDPTSGEGSADGG